MLIRDVCNLTALIAKIQKGREAGSTHKELSEELGIDTREAYCSPEGRAVRFLLSRRREPGNVNVT